MHLSGYDDGYHKKKYGVCDDENAYGDNDDDVDTDEDD